MYFAKTNGMEITQDEAFLHLSKWRDDSIPVAAHYLTQDGRSDCFNACLIESFDGETLVLSDRKDPHEFIGKFRHDAGQWIYAEFSALPEFPVHLAHIVNEEWPILGVGWTNLDVLILVPVAPIE